MDEEQSENRESANCKLACKVVLFLFSGYLKA